jgi:hypothetical protein
MPKSSSRTTVRLISLDMETLPTSAASYLSGTPPTMHAPCTGYELLLNLSELLGESGENQFAGTGDYRGWALQLRITVIGELASVSVFIKNCLPLSATTYC